eukprot:PLAT12483.4.p1 GENE.PLAT12483.4~~PLAT12483.4.p1  ORF type:complete len:526 (+),score=140.66 PLAT12483.4:187-1764(+)
MSKVVPLATTPDGMQSRAVGFKLIATLFAAGLASAWFSAWLARAAEGIEPQYKTQILLARSGTEVCAYLANAMMPFIIWQGMLPQALATVRQKAVHFVLPLLICFAVAIPARMQGSVLHSTTTAEEVAWETAYFALTALTLMFWLSAVHLPGVRKLIGLPCNVPLANWKWNAVGYLAIAVNVYAAAAIIIDNFLGTDLVLGSLGCAVLWFAVPQLDKRPLAASTMEAGYIVNQALFARGLTFSAGSILQTLLLSTKGQSWAIPFMLAAYSFAFTLARKAWDQLARRVFAPSRATVEFGAAFHFLVTFLEDFLGELIYLGASVTTVGFWIGLALTTAKQLTRDTDVMHNNYTRIRAYCGFGPPLTTEERAVRLQRYWRDWELNQLSELLSSMLAPCIVLADIAGGAAGIGSPVWTGGMTAAQVNDQLIAYAVLLLVELLKHAWVRHYYMKNQLQLLQQLKESEAGSYRIEKGDSSSSPVTDAIALLEDYTHEVSSFMWKFRGLLAWLVAAYVFEAVRKSASITRRL